MKQAAYTRDVFKTLSKDSTIKLDDGLTKKVKGPKFGLKAIMSKSAQLNAFHGVVGFKTETGEVLEGMSKYLLGHQITPQEKFNLLEELGDVSYYLTVIAKVMRFKLPSANRKQHLSKTTVPEALLRLDVLSTMALDLFKKAFYGKEVDYSGLGPIVLESFGVVYGIAGDCLGVEPSLVRESNIAKLSKRYPEGFFDVEAAEVSNRNIVAEHKVIENLQSVAKNN